MMCMHIPLLPAHQLDAAAAWPTCARPRLPTPLQVNYQFAAPENRLDDPEVQDAIRNGTCLNEQVMLRSLGWQGRGPQSNLTLE